ncbi:hypothetical protein [Pseudomonas sp. BMS12]|uniref:hypothetical protein n=1 Tax=Pseudomonas sp. BMS12 TaxID=1796033 RepID=UPI00083B49F2|nr:hypothetical protein [Pseudomonas sp. BMS12]
MSPHDNQLPQERELLEHYRRHSQGEPSAALDALILDAARQAASTPATRPSFAQRLHTWLFGAGSRTRWSVAFASLATLGIGLSLTLRTQEQVPSAYDLPSPAAAQAPLLREMAPKLAREMEQNKAEVERKKMAADAAAAYSASPPVAAMPRQAEPSKPAAAPPVQALSDMAGESIALSPEAQAEARAAAKAKAQAAAQARARAQMAQAQARRAPAGLAGSLAEEVTPLQERLREVLRLRHEGQPALADQLLQHLAQEYPQQDVQAELERLESAQD